MHDSQAFDGIPHAFAYLGVPIGLGADTRITGVFGVEGEAIASFSIRPPKVLMDAFVSH